jgi:pimeloyl-ACP methyl ester carboxylesterase
MIDEFERNGAVERELSAVISWGTTAVTADTRFLMREGGRLAYEDRGSGPLALCLPAPGDLRAEYRFLAPLLINDGFRVVAMDLRGHGESSADWSDYSVGRVAEDVTALLRYLEAGPALIIGTSITAGAAIHAAADAPELVQGLVLIGPLLHDTWPVWQRLLWLTPLLAPFWGPALWVRYYRTLYRTSQPEDLEPYLAALEAKLREPRRMAAVRQMATASRHDSELRMAHVAVPSLVVVGSEDPEYEDPVTAAWIVADQMRAEVVLAEGAGHHPQCEVPAWTASEIVAFAGAIASD